MRTCPDCLRPVEEDVRFCGGCGAACAAPVEVTDPFVGRSVNGKFRVEALIGQGGMGRVYRARHLTLDRPVVLKMLHRTYSDDPQISQRFQREARAASRLNHPNSIAVLDFGAAEDGTLFMAMEYLPGRDLARVISEGWPLPEARIIRIGAQVLSALGEAHAQGIIHRDLKPENVMVETRRDEPDFVKVLDFGIAKITAGADEPKLTAAGLVCGTPEYMSPEQARGAELDARSDLYSVGVILYQMATGDLPFHSDTPVGFLTKHLAEVPVAPRQLRPDLSVALDALIRRTLEKEAARRYPDAAAMRQALLACAGPLAVAPPPDRSTRAIDVTEAEPIEEPPGPAPAVRRRVALVAGGLALVVAATLGLVLRGGGAGPWVAPPVTEAVPLATAPARPTPVAPTSPAPATPSPAPSPQATPAAGRPAAPGPRPGGRAQALELVRRGDARRTEGDLDGAIRAYLAAEAADGALPAVQKKLALCYQQQGDTRRAREHYRRYLAGDPPDAAKVRLILETLR